MSEINQQGQTVHNQINVAGDATIGHIGDNYGLTIEEVRHLMVTLQRDQQQTVWNGRNPYRGLEAYEEADAGYFFGRESLVATVIERVRMANFITISGPSGSGKSSLAKAGVLHALRQGAIAGSDQWLLAAMQPKGDPLEQLARAIEHLTQTPDSGDYLRQNGRQNPQALHKQVSTLLGGSDTRRFVLLVDQFEELFTQTKDPALRRDLIALLTEAAQAADGRCKIILSLRSDFVSHCASYDTLRALISQQFQLVGAMSPQDLAKAITLPALEVGAKIDPALVARIIADMKGSPEALPLMSFALRDLFAAEETAVGQPMELTLAKYIQRGGLDNALEQHANKVFAAFSEDQQQIAEAVFSKLIEVGQGRPDTRRTATLAELIPADGDEAAIMAVVQTLSDKNVRLLTTNGIDEGMLPETAVLEDVTVTIAHEKLIDAWPWLRELVDNNRELISLQTQIESDARAWHGLADDSYLYRGGRLLQIEEREAVLRPLLSSAAHEFITASTAERQRLAAEAEAVRQQEEELISQKRVGRILRGATAVVGILLIIAVISAIQASSGQAQARNAEATATVAQGQAEIDAQNALQAEATATIAQGEALIQANNALNAEATATVAQGQAEIERDNALVAQATATVAQGQAELAAAEVERLARSNQVSSLAASTWSVLALGSNDELSVLLGIEAAHLTEELEVSLADQVYAGLNNSLIQPFFDSRLRTVKNNTEWVYSIAYSPNGEQLAFTSLDGTVQLWNPANPAGDPIILVGPSSVYSVAYRPDGEQLASASLDGMVRLWDLTNPASTPTILEGHRGVVLSVVYSPDGQQLASAGADGTVQLWDLANLVDDPAILEGHTNAVNSVAYSPDGQQLASASDDGTVKLWDLTNLAADPAILEGHTSWVNSVAYSPDGRQLASASYDGTVRLWDMTNPTADPTIIAGHTDWVNSVAYSPDGQQLASASDDGTVRLWDLVNPTLAPVILEGYMDEVLSVAYSPDGRQLAAAGIGMARLWSLTKPEAVPAVMGGHLDRLWSVAYSLDGRQLASTGDDGVLRLWDLANPATDPTVLTGHTGMGWSVAYSPDGRQLASASADGTVRLWDLTNPATAPNVLERYTYNVYSVAYSPDGQQLASADSDSKIQLWDLKEPTAPKVILELDTYGVFSVAYRPDGQQLASTTLGGSIQLWDLANPTASPVILEEHTSEVLSVAYSPNGQQLASASHDRTVRLWNSTNPAAAPIILEGHSGTVRSVAYNPNGRQLASASEDGTVRLWDLTNPGAAPIVLEGHTDGVLSVAYSPDGQQLASSSRDGTVRLWPTVLGLVDIGCRTVRRNLSWEEWQQYLPLEPLYQLTCPNLPAHPSVAVAVAAMDAAAREAQIAHVTEQSPEWGERLRQEVEAILAAQE